MLMNLLEPCRRKTVPRERPEKKYFSNLNVELMKHITYEEGVDMGRIRLFVSNRGSGRVNF